jgi:streptomycin 6-kinase
MTIAARLMPRLWRDGQPSVNFPDVRQWLKALQCSRALTEIFQWEPNLRVLVNEAGVTSEELLNSSGPHVLLHGDYHHGNILRDGNDSWRAIDAKCVWGECEYEAGALLRNPMPWIGQQSDLTHLMQRRVDLLAEESGFERRRIRDWGRVQAVLSAVWTAQDHGTLDQSSLHVAEALGRVEV